MRRCLSDGRMWTERMNSDVVPPTLMLECIKPLRVSWR
jgi:hypothetical protein